MPKVIIESIGYLNSKKFSGSYNIDLVLWNLLKAILIGIVAGLLYRVAMVKENARFVRHLALALVLFAGAALVSVISAFIVDRIASESMNEILLSRSETAAASSKIIIQRIERTSDGIGTIMSFFSTFWMALTWFLITRYPTQGMPRDFVVTAMGGSSLTYCTRLSCSFLATRRC